jgi:hypothetical protein
MAILLLCRQDIFFGKQFHRDYIFLSPVYKVKVSAVLNNMAKNKPSARELAKQTFALIAETCRSSAITDKGLLSETKGPEPRNKSRQQSVSVREIISAFKPGRLKFALYTRHPDRFDKSDEWKSNGLSDNVKSVMRQFRWDGSQNFSSVALIVNLDVPFHDASCANLRCQWTLDEAKGGFNVSTTLDRALSVVTHILQPKLCVLYVYYGAAYSTSGAGPPGAGTTEWKDVSSLFVLVSEIRV